MAKRSIEIEREYRQYTKMSPEFVHLTGESLKQQIGGLENKVEKVSAKIENLSAEIEELKKSDKEEGVIQPVSFDNPKLRVGRRIGKKKWYYFMLDRFVPYLAFILKGYYYEQN